MMRAENQGTGDSVNQEEVLPGDLADIKLALTAFRKALAQMMVTAEEAMRGAELLTQCLGDIEIRLSGWEEEHDASDPVLAATIQKGGSDG